VHQVPGLYWTGSPISVRDLIRIAVWAGQMASTDEVSRLLYQKYQALNKAQRKRLAQVLLDKPDDFYKVLGVPDVKAKNRKAVLDSIPQPQGDTQLTRPEPQSTPMNATVTTPETLRDILGMVFQQQQEASRQMIQTLSAYTQETIQAT
ncbi:14997_t:CDS:1, partial [Acaulospora colombiana]